MIEINDVVESVIVEKNRIVTKVLSKQIEVVNFKDMDENLIKQSLAKDFLELIADSLELTMDEIFSYPSNNKCYKKIKATATLTILLPKEEKEDEQ